MKKQSSFFVLEIKFELKWFYSSLFHIFEKKIIMRNLIFIFSIILVSSCVSKKKISESEKENIKKELSEMVEIDQKYAGIPFGSYITNTEKFFTDRDSINKVNKEKIDNYIKKYGFLGFDKVGEEGSNHFWLIVQHSDNFPDFQKKVLKMMKKEVDKNNARKSNYAYLFDRIRVNKKQKQYFGTQCSYNKLGQATPKYGLEDSINVDERRKKYELEPLKKYLNERTKAHFEMNKTVLISQGIKEPQLYQ